MHPSICPSIHRCPSLLHSSNHPSILPPTHQSIHPSVRPPIRPSTPPLTHASKLLPFICSLIRPSPTQTPTDTSVLHAQPCTHLPHSPTQPPAVRPAGRPYTHRASHSYPALPNIHAFMPPCVRPFSHPPHSRQALPPPTPARLSHECGHPSVHPSVRPSNPSSVHSSFVPSLCTSVCLRTSWGPPLRTVLYLSRPASHPWIHLLIHSPSVHLSFPLSVQQPVRPPASHSASPFASAPSTSRAHFRAARYCSLGIKVRVSWFPPVFPDQGHGARTRRTTFSPDKG